MKTRRLAAFRLICVALLAHLFNGCASVAIPVSGAGPAVEAWVTTADKARLLARETGLRFAGDPPRDAKAVNIEIDAARRYQTMAGFGASITDASAWLIRHRMNEAQRGALLRELFGRGHDGIGFDFTRLSIGASDFSLRHYSLDDRPAGETDMSLAYFSIDANRADLLPVVKQALAINPSLRIMASPWSAPAWMKTSNSLIQGALRPDMHDVFARYLLRYLDAYAAEGVPVFALTLQNEPHFEPRDYPGMRVDPATRATLFGRHLGPLLARRGLDTQLFDWDHNWDEPQSPRQVLSDPLARGYVSGIAWHCYAGQVQAQEELHDAFPDKDAWFTECSGGEWKAHWRESLPWIARNLIIGATRGWAKGVLMWNLALDENHGPHLGGCRDCRGVVTIDSATGEVTRNVEYYALAHASKFVRPGAQRIFSSAGSQGIESVAFRNADDGSIALIVCNSTPRAAHAAVTFEGRAFSYEMPRESMATFTWTPIH